MTNNTTPPDAAPLNEQELAEFIVHNTRMLALYGPGGSYRGPVHNGERVAASMAQDVARLLATIAELQREKELLAAADQSATLRELINRYLDNDGSRDVYDAVELSKVRREIDAALSASPVEKRAAIEIDPEDESTWPSLVREGTNGFKCSDDVLVGYWSDETKQWEFHVARFCHYSRGDVGFDKPGTHWAPLPDWSKS